MSKARFDSVQDDIARQLANISSYNERHVQAVTRLEEKDPEIPADSDSEVTCRLQFAALELTLGSLDQFLLL